MIEPVRVVEYNGRASPSHVSSTCHASTRPLCWGHLSRLVGTLRSSGEFGAYLSRRAAQMAVMSGCVTAGAHAPSPKRISMCYPNV